jgi:glycogen(starch) synthase
MRADGVGRRAAPSVRPGLEQARVARGKTMEPAAESKHPGHGAARRLHVPPGTLLCEVAWEVCQQLGGIYTVVHSKVPRMMEVWGENGCLIGPYNPQVSPVEFEETTPSGPFGEAAAEMKKAGCDVHFGHWLISGHPHVVLLNPAGAMGRLNDIKFRIWERLRIDMLSSTPLIDQVVAFGYLVEQFFRILASREAPTRPIIGHFHEWMGGTAIPEIRRSGLPVAIVFTTHATQLGRFLAMDNSLYYEQIPKVSWDRETTRFRIEIEAGLERAAATAAHVLTTVSDVTGFECEHLLGRKPDAILPNGRNLERFVVFHEFQNLHRRFRDRIHQFVIGHFFPSYTFDLDRTLYFFTSGRYEYANKGFDLSIEAMRRLRTRLLESRTERTVVFFIITKAAFRSVNADVLQARAVLEEIRRDCTEIQEQMGSRLFMAVATRKWPRFDDLVDEYWRLRLRRALHAWRTASLPALVTHDLAHREADAILNHLHNAGFQNRPEDPVKIVYHPDFVSSSSPLFGMDYDQFVRGCHLGIFPSLYEPWGYAPLECVMLGIPTITSDLAGFGSYVQQHLPEHDKRGIWVVPRRGVRFDDSAEEIARHAFDFARLERRDRIALRNRVESTSDRFDWSVLYSHYMHAHELALQKLTET